MNEVETLKHNIERAHIRFSHIMGEVMEAPPLQTQLLVRRERTLLINEIQLTSAYDRRAEAMVQLAHLPIDVDSVTVYGTGLGDLPRALLQRPTTRSLRIVVTAPSVFQAALSFEDHRDWLEDPRLELVAADTDTSIMPPFALSPTELRFMPERLYPLRDSLVRWLATPYRERIAPFQEARARAQMAENASFCASQTDISVDFDAQRERPVAVVAAGPSLGESLADLKAAQAELCIIAVNTALPPLLRAGIVPEYVIAADFGKQAVRHFSSDLNALKNSTLIALPTLPSELFQRWPGRILIFSREETPVTQELNHKSNSRLFCKGTVLHPAVDFAVRLGASQVVLFGADFGYPMDKSHTDGTIFQKNAMRKTGLTLPSSQGKLIDSEPKFIDALRDLEAYLTRTSGPKFWNAGALGARIRGAPHNSLPAIFAQQRRRTEVSCG